MFCLGSFLEEPIVEGKPVSCLPMKGLQLFHIPLARRCQDKGMALPRAWVGPELPTQAQGCVAITLLS